MQVLSKCRSNKLKNEAHRQSEHSKRHNSLGTTEPLKEMYREKEERNLGRGRDIEKESSEMEGATQQRR